MIRDTVLLVNPNRMRPPVAPIGLDYLAEGLAARGYEPLLCDLTFAEDWQSALTDALASADPLAVGITVRNIDDAYFASQDFVLEQTAEIVRHALATTNAPVVLGGVGYSLAPEAVMRFTGATYGIAGAGDQAFPDLLDCLREQADPGSLPGLAWRLPDGRIIANPSAGQDPAPLPPFSRGFADNPRYFVEGGQAGIETKRGCTGSCAYCVEPFAKGRHMHLRLPAHVAAEFRALLDQGIDVVHLCDSEFNLPVEHARAVCAELLRTGLAGSVRWYTYAFPVPFDIDLARAMVDAGCVGINFGVDHADEAILRRLGRTHTRDDIRRTAQACKDAGLTVMFDMLLGSPGETRQSLEEAVQLMQEVSPDRVGLSCGVRVYPNTPLAKSVLAQGPLPDNPNLHGALAHNDDLLRPIFYVDAALDEDIHQLVWSLVGDDRRFLAADPAKLDQNYNYNDNSALANAIRDGARGAYWDILRRLDHAS